MPKKAAYHHGNLREALLDAAEALLRKRGPEELTLREVARRAGVSHGAPYHHFESRDALLAAVAERGFAGLAAAMQQVPPAGAKEHLVGICRAYVDFASRYPTRFRLMFGPLLARKAEFPALKQQAEASFAMLLDASRAVAPEQALPLALAGWSLAHGLSHLAINDVLAGLPAVGPLPAHDVLAEQLGAWMLAGLPA